MFTWVKSTLVLAVATAASFAAGSGMLVAYGSSDSLETCVSSDDCLIGAYCQNTRGGCKGQTDCLGGSTRTKAGTTACTVAIATMLR